MPVKRDTKAKQGGQLTHRFRRAGVADSIETPINFLDVDRPRQHQPPKLPPHRDREALIKARQNAAGRFGFILGCIAAVSAASINLWRTPRPFELTSVALALLMAALNIPFGIALGLLGERFTRPSDDQR